MTANFTDPAVLSALFGLDRQVIKGYVPSEDPLHVSEFGFSPLQPSSLKALAAGTSASDAVNALVQNPSLLEKSAPFVSHAAYRRHVAYRALEWAAWTRYPFSHSDTAIIDRFTSTVAPSFVIPALSFFLVASLTRSLHCLVRTAAAPAALVATGAVMGTVSTVDKALESAFSSLATTSSPLALRTSAIALAASRRGGAPATPTPHPLVAAGLVRAYGAPQAQQAARPAATQGKKKQAAQ